MRLGNAAILGLALLSASSVAAPKSAQPPSPLVGALVNCQHQADDAARLRCYDAAVAALTEAAGSGKIVVVEREDVRRTRRSLFGFALPRIPFFNGDDSAEGQQDELTAKVASWRSLGYDRYQIRLEDGALWETTEGSSAVDAPRNGDTVVIKRGPLGSYMMHIAGQRAVRARRVG
jgi:hypothetical protein